MRIRRYLILLLLLLVAGGALSAQGAPQVINIALADLNQRLGTAYTLNDINWRWEQQTYEDTSLGCPQEGQTYTQQQIVGYLFEFFIGEQVYDYRVSGDGEILVFCGVSDVAPEGEGEGDTGAEVIGSDAYTNPLCPVPPEGITYMPTRLTTDIQARVTPGLPNTLRGEPDAQAAATGEIPGGAVFTVTDGPVCDDEGYLWWQVNYDGTVGWTAEGRNGDYFIEPLPGIDLPAPRIALEGGALSLVQELSRLQGNFSGAMAFAPVVEGEAQTNRLVAGGGFGADSVAIYDLNNLAEGTRFLNGPAAVTAVDFGPNPNLPLLGSGDGGIRLWNIAPDARVVERAYLLSQNTAVSAAAFSPDGATMAAAGGQAFGGGEAAENLYAINLWSVDTVSQIDTLRGHSDQVTALVFNGNSEILFSGSLDGTFRFWYTGAPENNSVVEFEQPVTDLALSADSSVMAIGLADGSIALFNMNTGERDATLTGAHFGAVTGLAFSPDGSLLVSGATDSGAVVVWDLTAETVTPQVIGNHELPLLDVAFSPDSTLIATSSEDGTIRLWGLSNNFG